MLNKLKQIDKSKRELRDAIGKNGKLIRQINHQYSCLKDEKQLDGIKLEYDKNLDKDVNFTITYK